MCGEVYGKVPIAQCDDLRLVGPRKDVLGKREETKKGKCDDVVCRSYERSNMVPVICLGCNKDLCSRRSKYKSHEALRGCDLGVRDCLQVYCG